MRPFHRRGHGHFGLLVRKGKLEVLNFPCLCMHACAGFFKLIIKSWFPWSRSFTMEVCGEAGSTVPGKKSSNS